MRFISNPFTNLLDAINASGSGGGPVGTLTGNDGIPVPPDGSGNIDVLGNNTQGINITGDAGSSTLTVAGINASTSQIGVAALATNGQAMAQSSTTVVLTPSNITSLFASNPLPASQGGTGISSPTTHSLIVGGGATSYTQLGVATNGQIPIGSTGADPVLANITSSDGSVVITNGAGTINLSVINVTRTITTVTHAQTPYTVLSTDEFLAVDTSGGVVTIKLPNAPTTGRTITIKDSKGDASTSNISITTVGGSVTIDGQTTYTMVSNYSAMNVIFDSAAYEVF